MSFATALPQDPHRHSFSSGSLISSLKIIVFLSFLLTTQVYCNKLRKSRQYLEAKRTKGDILHKFGGLVEEVCTPLTRVFVSELQPLWRRQPVCVWGGGWVCPKGTVFQGNMDLPLPPASGLPLWTCWKLLKMEKIKQVS